MTYRIVYSTLVHTKDDVRYVQEKMHKRTYKDTSRKTAPIRQACDDSTIHAVQAMASSHPSSSQSLD